MGSSLHIPRCGRAALLQATADADESASEQQHCGRLWHGRCGYFRKGERDVGNQALWHIDQGHRAPALILGNSRSRQGGYRQYSAATFEELQFIKKGQGLGFSLEEIGEILKLSRAGETPCSRVLDLAERNLAAAEDRIRQLHAFRDRLAAQIKKWKGKTMPNCNARGLCQIINSAELPEKASKNGR